MADDDAKRTPDRLLLDAESIPKLARHIKLRRDETRDQWVLLAPERILTPSETAIAVLQLCDGATSMDQIARKLAAEYDAPAADILADILPVLQDLADRGYVVT